MLKDSTTVVMLYSSTFNIQLKKKLIISEPRGNKILPREFYSQMMLYT